MAFEASFGAGDGWGGDTSFSIAEPSKQDSELSKTADRLPIPVTISTLCKLTEEKVVLGEMHFASALSIGRVARIVLDGSSKQFYIADPEDPSQEFMAMTFTGISEDEDVGLANEPKEGEMIFVAGKLRSFDGTLTMMTFKIRALDDPQEYDCHLRECQLAKLYWEKNVPALLRTGETALTGCAAGAPAPREGASTAATGAASASNTAMNNGGGTPARRAQSSTSAASNASSNGGGDIKDQICQLLARKRQETSASGERTDMSVHEIAAALGRAGQGAQIREILEGLSQEGLVYSTVDEEHYEAI